MKSGGFAHSYRDDVFMRTIRPRLSAGRSIRRRINHPPDRLNYPMKRAGRRGEGKFETH